jgi:hypothetical protein
MADNREAIMFKKVPEGYVFRAPNPWVLGRIRFYLVNEAQKTKLLAVITARSQAVFWVTFAVLTGTSTAARAESEAIKQDSAVLQREIDAIRSQVDALQTEIKTIR